MKYDREASLSGVPVQVVHTDNGVVTPKYFMYVMLGKVKHIIFSGFEASCQNGIAKRLIKKVVYILQTMLI